MASSFYLLRDIEFPRDYSAVVDFDNKELQRLYFQKRRVSGYPTEYNYIRGETQSIRVEIPQIEVQNYSYFEFTNTTPVRSDGSGGIEKTYYAFIDEVRYLDPTTSQIIFTIDVWQTYLFDYKIKDSFIDREHQNRCAKALKPISDTEYLKPIFNTEIENIEVGSEYEIIESDVIENGNAIQDGELSTVVYWLEVISTEPIFKVGEKPVSINPDYPSEIDPSPVMTLPIYVYYVPFVDLPNKLFERYDPNGNPNYWMTIGEIYEKCVDNPKVVAIRVESYPPFKFRYVYNDANGDILIRQDTSSLLDPYTIFVIKTEDIPTIYNLILLRDDLSKISTLKNEYDYVIDKSKDRRIENETKLRQYPYEFLSITNYRGDALKLKPEYLSDNEFNIRYQKSISFNHKSRIYVEGYLGDHSGQEYGLIDNTVSELPLVTDAYKEYIANSKATATTGVAVNAGMGLGGLALGTALLGAGGPAGSLAFLALGLGMTGLAGVKSELIKQSNLKEAPLSERQSGNDLLFDLITRNLTYRLVRKRITPQYYYRLYDYFYRYGYKANRFGIPNLRSRYYFNYIKTINIEIVGNINNEVKEKIKQIYNNGTTIWHCREDNPEPELFMYEKENAEVNL